MADAIPTPPDKQPKTQSTVVVQPPMSQWTALKEAGWWKPFDTAILGLIVAVWVTGFYWKMFGDPGTSGLVALLLANVSFKLIWLISLVFRCSWFVLRLHADIATLPQESARIAVAYLSGQAPPPKNNV
jgi:hypothetical protein